MCVGPRGRGWHFEAAHSHGRNRRNHRWLRRGKGAEILALAKLVGQADPADFAGRVKFLSETRRIRKFGFTHGRIVTRPRPTARDRFITFVFRNGATRRIAATAWPHGVRCGFTLVISRLRQPVPSFFGGVISFEGARARCPLRACFKITRGAVFGEKAVWQARRRRLHCAVAHNDVSGN